MRIYLQLFICICLLPLRSLADATPFKAHSRIDLVYTDATVAGFDSCGIIYHNIQTNRPDTFFNCKGYQCMFITNGQRIEMIRLVPDSFRVYFCYKDKKLTSPVLYANGLVSYHRLQLSATGVTNNTPVFGTPYSHYLFALCITILLEVGIAFFYFRRKKIRLNNLLYVAGVNLLTHPLLWLVCVYLTGFAIGNFIGEPLVLLTESLLLYTALKPQVKPGQMLLLSLLMNLTSFVVGGFLYMLLAL